MTEEKPDEGSCGPFCPSPPRRRSDKLPSEQTCSPELGAVALKLSQPFISVPALAVGRAPHAGATQRHPKG